MKINSLFVIDDDKIYHFLLKNLFKQNGIAAGTTFFHNGNEAIEAIKKIADSDEMPDLILLDVNMPIMNGWQFIEEYKNLSESFVKRPVIYMISSSNDEVDLERARSYGDIIRDYLLKPICKEDLDKIFVPVEN